MSCPSIDPIVSPHLQALLRQTAKRNISFTVCELRDHLLKQPALAGFDGTTLRRYVRDQINRRVRQGLVEYVGLHPKFKRRHLFQLTAAFDAHTDDTHEGTIHTADDVEPLDAKLRRDSEQLRAQMEASDYRLQTFQEIAEKYPDALDEIAPLFEREKAQARLLGEKLKAYADVQRQLAQAGGES